MLWVVVFAGGLEGFLKIESDAFAAFVDMQGKEAADLPRVALLGQAAYCDRD